MPVKKEWYLVEDITGKRSKGGINEYRVKFSNYEKEYWIPYFNITSDLISKFENERREKANQARESRWLKRAIKRELGEAIPEAIPIPGKPPKERKNRKPKW